MTLPPVLIVTGTDTEVGKTVVTAALAATLSLGRSVAVLKAAQTGVTPDEPGDAAEVRRLAGVDSVHEGARLRDPLAPTVAARLEGVTLPSMADVAGTVHDLAAEHDVVLVEGAGGVLVGLDATGAGLPELAASLQVPAAFVVVTRAGLGTLNHTALTVEALRRRDLPVLGLVVGSVPAEPGLADRTNLDGLADLTGVPVLGRVPAGAGRWEPGAFRGAAPGWFTDPCLLEEGERLPDCT